MGIHNASKWFGVARTENDELSVYGTFVVPPDIEDNNLLTIGQSVVLVGGRGIGKTAFLRYFSHWTQFDARKQDVDESSLKTIILYWKPDTAFCRSLRVEWLGEEKAKNIFLALSSLNVLEELLHSIDNIGKHFPDIKTVIYNNLFKETLSDILKENIIDSEQAHNLILKRQYEVVECVHGSSRELPILVPPNVLLNRLFQIIRKSDSRLFSTSFRVFVDEFENLNEQQQILINDFRKHSTRVQIWSVAHKEFAQVTNATSSDEKLQELDDFKTIKMYENLDDEDKKILVAEIILNIIYRNTKKSNSNIIDFDVLSDLTQIKNRQDRKYTNLIKQKINRILPSPSVEELCSIALENTSCKNLIIKQYKKIKPQVSKNEIDFFLNSNPQFVIAHHLIFEQKSFDLTKFENYLNNGIDTSYKNKIETYCFAALLALNLASAYINIPVYAGFDRFVKISSGNIRHAMLLIHHALIAMKGVDNKFKSLDEFPVISYNAMHLGVLRTSKKLIEEIQNFTPQGRLLATLANRLGEVFISKHKIKGQPEPEMNHFFIKFDYGDLPKEISKLILNAKCWRLFLEFPSSKDKDKTGSASYEYQLNPIYCPGFGISYRKMRRLELSLDEFKILYSGDSKAFQELKDSYLHKDSNCSINLSLI